MCRLEKNPFKNMPLQQNINAFLGAAVLGVIGAAGMFLVEHYRQGKMRNAMARDLARLDREVIKLRTELQQLQNRTNTERQTRTRRSNSKTNNKKANSVLSTTTDDYLSASNMDSSDMEFYDVSEDEMDNTFSSTTLETLLHELDKKLDLGNVEEVEEALLKLEDLCIEHPEDPELLYRIGKAHHKIADKSDDKRFIQEKLTKGIAACSSALRIAPNHAEVHKWYAVLIGSRTDFVSLQEKINDGHLFKKHVDTAISINPNDASLHYMLGRFDYEVAGLKWYERKLAAAVYGEPPNSTFEEACSHFLEAERLARFEWKDNKWMLAKCKIAMGEFKEAVQWLEKASRCKHGDGLDDKVDKDIQELLEKYSTYR